MTLDKAIEILQLTIEAPPSGALPAFISTLELSIEALKHVKAQYDPDHQMMRRPLPGETRE